MKMKSLLLALALALTAPLGRAEISFEFFYDSLAPHGEWVQIGDYGLCWRPAGVDADWTPYSDGYWSYTDAGWTWVSYEEFGGIVYHYGRWVNAEDEGWCWVPDYDWGPAWVSWRSSERVVGWAPLPPEAHWQRDTGISVWADSHYDIGPGSYNFCNVHDFGEPVLRPVLISRVENVIIIQNTVNVTNITHYDRPGFGAGFVFCGGPSFVTVNRFVNRPIPALKLVQHTNITNINVKQVNVFNSVQRGNQLAVFAPAVTRPVAAFVAPKSARVIPADKLTKGWAGVRDADTRTQLRAKLTQESRGLTPQSAPARAVQAAEVKAVPAKADPAAPSPAITARGRRPATSGTAPLPVQPKALEPKPAIVATPEKARKVQAQAPQPVVTAPVQPIAPVTPPVTIEQRGRAKTAKPAATDTDARERAIAAQREQAAALEAAKQQRIETARQQKAAQISRDQQMEAVKKQQADTARRQQSLDTAKSQQAEADRQQKAAAIARQQQLDASRNGQAVEAARMKQADAARRQQALDATRSQQVDAARAAQASAAARQHQLDAARSQQVVEASRAKQADAARRQQAVDAAKMQQVEAARAQQSVRQQPIVRSQPAPQVRQVQPQPAPQPAPTAAGKRQLTPEEIEALKKQRGR